jgi:esterase/lipase superfamily enzyme
MELLVFGHAGASVLFFPTRTARFYDYENWKIVHVLQDKIEKGLLQLFCVDSVDAESFYALYSSGGASAYYVQAKFQ